MRTHRIQRELNRRGDAEQYRDDAVGPRAIGRATLRGQLPNPQRIQMLAGINFRLLGGNGDFAATTRTSDLRLSGLGNFQQRLTMRAFDLHGSNVALSRCACYKCSR